MILKTYARLWADDLDRALPLLRRLVGAEPDLRFSFGSVELAAIGDLLVIAGPEEARAPYAHASATVVVSDLDELATALAEEGAVVTAPKASGPTGSFLYARQPGGPEVEYVEWVPDLVRRVVR